LDITIHRNFTQPHQVKLSQLLKQGFRKHGIDAALTSCVTQKSDIHIILGPHYAKQHWLKHERVILLDRCYYNSSHNHVSVGWMNNIGGRDFKLGSGKDKLKTLEPIGNKSLFLADYNGVVENADIVRLHPENCRYETSLQDSINECNRATGYETTSLVQAALCGLEINCKGNTSILKKDNWLELLPYANWSYDEIRSGELWQHLQL